jgi:lon-related putative ATP-dependent protease
VNCNRLVRWRHINGRVKTTLIRQYLEQHAAGLPAPNDLCYVHQFADGHRPIALRPPAGRARALSRDMLALVDELRVAIPRAFDSKEYGALRDKVINELEETRNAEITHLEAHVAKGGFKLIKTPGGLALVMTVNGMTISNEDFEKLSPEQREKLTKIREKLGVAIVESVQRIREIEKNARAALEQLNTETAAGATRHRFDELRQRYQALPDVLAYFDAAQNDIIQHADLFRKAAEAEGGPPDTNAEGSPFRRYLVNVLVDNGDLKGAPVIVESNPTYHNLIGRVEHRAVMGEVTTDFTLIKPGALHRANGGYLVIPARECLLNAFAWDALKRALKDCAVRIEELGAQLGLLSTVTLEPQPVPLDVKVVLIDSPMLYYLLYAYDEDFQKLFKVKADFTTEMPRTADNENAYSLFVRTISRQDHVAPFDRPAVARVVEYGARLAGDQDKLSTRFGEIADLIRETGLQAVRAGHATVTGDDVQAAIEARRFRHNLIEECLQEEIAQGTLMIATDGAIAGQINGLSVLSTGDYAFGQPARITATAGPGRRGVVSIEREVELSGPIHGKGVLILSGYLLQRYGRTDPLTLSASLVFEQSYGMVEGDSATLAELYALLSMLADAPLAQYVAVTGSVNQYGSVQAVGGVTEKVEGFFDACRAAGLTGRQGVLLPAANARHLMLRDDVVAAVAAGQFHVWTAASVDDGLPLLTGLCADEVHRRVADRLARHAARLREDARMEEGG